MKANFEGKLVDLFFCKLDSTTLLEKSKKIYTLRFISTMKT